MAAPTALASATAEAEPGPSVARRLRSGTLAALRRPSVQVALAGLGGVLVTVAVLPPPPFADTYRVWSGAAAWPALPPDYPGDLMHHVLRLGIVWPTRVAQEILGEGHLALATTSALFMALFAAGLYATARALFGRTGVLVGLLAVPLVLLNPYFTLVDLYSPGVLSTATGSLDPDMPAAGLFSFGVVALVLASRRSGPRQLWWLAAAGACFGLSYLCREFMALMFPAIPVFFLLLRIPWRRLVVPAGPALAVLGVELVVNAVVHDDPLARFHVAAEHQAERTEPLTVAYIISGFAYRALRTDGLGLIFPAALAVTALGAFLLRDRRLVLLLVWFAALWVPLTLMGGLLDPYHPHLRVHLPRYWMPVQGVVVIGALATAVLGYPRLRRRIDVRPPAAVIAVVLAAYLVLCVGTLGRVNRDQDWRELRAFLVAHPEITVIHTDDRTRQTTTFYTRDLFGTPEWHGTVDEFRHERPTLPTVRGGEAYLQSLRFGALEQPDPAQGWRMEFRSSNGVLTLWRRT